MDSTTKIQPTNQDRQLLIKLVRKWANANTDGLLEKNCHTFSTPDIEGFIGYKIKARNAVVFGDPVCSPKDVHALAKAFDEDCKKKGLGIVYTIVSKEFAEWAADNFSGIAIEFGNKFVLNPHKNPTRNSGSKAVLVRKKVKSALREGIIVKEYLGDDPNIENQIEAVALKWLEKRHGPQIYLSKISLFNDRLGKRWFYAQKDDAIIGLLSLNELQSQKGWLLNNVMINDDAKGLSELLIISTLEVLEKEGCQFVLAGPVPLKQLGKMIGISGLKSSLIRSLFKCARYFFHLDGHATFWEKFQPQCESSFLLFPHKNLRLSSIKALMQAFNVSKG